MDKNLFKLIENKNRKEITRILAFIVLSIIVFNVLVFAIYDTSKSMDRNILNNETLSLISLNGYNKEGQEYPYDTSQIENIENISFVNKTQPIFLELSDDEDLSKNYNLIIQCIDSKYSNYVNINNMKDNIIYVPNNSEITASELVTKINSKDFILKVVKSKSQPPLIYYNDAFVSINTYNKIRQELGEDFFKYVQTEYLIGVNKPENVYDVVRVMESLYKDDDTQILYQASGLEGLFKETKTMIYVLISIIIIFIIFMAIIINYLSKLIIKSNIRDMMVLYLNGFSREDIYIEFKEMLNKKARIPIIISVILSLIFNVLILQMQNPGNTIDLNNILWLIIIDIIMALVILLSFNLSMKRIIKVKTNQNNISQLLRN
ncbi:MAG: hypothetical protein WAO56_12660 [Miniphocaeibacter sp.]|uniref:hypothetical protein n=1 Tax=Miniphocaeibacter sp. TaxID=3100973 RepID=UPI003BAEEF96